MDTSNFWLSLIAVLSFCEDEPFGYKREGDDGSLELNEYLTPREVMELLAIGKNAFYKMAQSGQLPAFRVGKRWRGKRTDIELWYR